MEGFLWKSGYIWTVWTYLLLCMYSLREYVHASTLCFFEAWHQVDPFSELCRKCLIWLVSVMASTRVKNCSAAQPVYSIHFMMPKGRKGWHQHCSNVHRLLSNFLKCSFQIPVLSVGDCCPLTATVWFPWAVKQDRGQTTDLTILYDIWCFPFWHMICPFWGKLWPKVQRSMSVCYFLSINLSFRGSLFLNIWMAPFWSHANTSKTQKWRMLVAYL